MKFRLTAATLKELLENAPWNSTDAWKVGELLGAIAAHRGIPESMPERKNEALEEIYRLAEVLSRTK